MAATCEIDIDTLAFVIAKRAGSIENIQHFSDDQLKKLSHKVFDLCIGVGKYPPCWFVKHLQKSNLRLDEWFKDGLVGAKFYHAERFFQWSGADMLERTGEEGKIRQLILSKILEALPKKYSTYSFS